MCRRERAQSGVRLLIFSQLGENSRGRRCRLPINGADDLADTGGASHLESFRQPASHWKRPSPASSTLRLLPSTAHLLHHRLHLPASRPAHAASKPELFEFEHKALLHVLAAAIGMVQQPRRWLPASHGVPPGCNHKERGQGRGAGPADDAPAQRNWAFSLTSMPIPAKSFPARR